MTTAREALKLGRARKGFQLTTAQEAQIAEHACRKYSGRIGRSAAARSFDEAAVLLAVAAHIRHRETNYDELLAKEEGRRVAREHVRFQVAEILQSWKCG